METKSAVSSFASPGIAAASKACHRPSPLAAPAPAAACAGLHRRAAAAFRGKVQAFLCLWCISSCSSPSKKGAPEHSLHCKQGEEFSFQHCCLTILTLSVQAEALCRLPYAVAGQPAPGRAAALAEPAASYDPRPPCEAADMEQILKERGACGVRAESLMNSRFCTFSAPACSSNSVRTEQHDGFFTFAGGLYSQLEEQKKPRYTRTGAPQTLHASLFLLYAHFVGWSSAWLGLEPL